MMPSPHERFLDVPPDLADADKARYVVLPIPFEQTVTYRKGTAAGPLAIIEASRQVEWLDEELDREIHTPGIATYPMIQPAPGPGAQFERVLLAARSILKKGQFLLALGGEHSLTVPLVQAVSERYEPISVLQVDAHADLRDRYEGTDLSHACVMRRVVEITPRIVQVGIRSYSREERDACPELVERFITPAEIARDDGWIDRAVERLGGSVYITLDMDGLDPSIAPGVGTPEPGGLSYGQVTRLLRQVCSRRTVVAADIMETRPLGKNHVTEFVAARLACKIIAYTQLAK